MARTINVYPKERPDLQPASRMNKLEHAALRIVASLAPTQRDPDAAAALAVKLARSVLNACHKSRLDHDTYTVTVRRSGAEWILRAPDLIGATVLCEPFIQAWSHENPDEFLTIRLPIGQEITYMQACANIAHNADR